MNSRSGVGRSASAVSGRKDKGKAVSGRGLVAFCFSFKVHFWCRSATAARWLGGSGSGLLVEISLLKAAGQFVFSKVTS